MILRQLSGMLLPLGFTFDGDYYVRPQNEGVCSVYPNCSFRGNGDGAFTLYLGVRFESLRLLLDWDGPLNTPTFLAPINDLHPDREFHEWTFANEESLRALAPVIAAEIHSVAIPFFEKFSHIDAIQDTLQSTDRHNWYLSGGERRLCILAAIEWVRGNHGAALKIVDDGIEERLSKMEKYRYELEKLKRRLMSVELRSTS